MNKMANFAKNAFHFVVNNPVLTSLAAYITTEVGSKVSMTILNGLEDGTLPNLAEPIGMGFLGMSTLAYPIWAFSTAAGIYKLAVTPEHQEPLVEGVSKALRTWGKGKNTPPHHNHKL